MSDEFDDQPQDEELEADASEQDQPTPPEPTPEWTTIIEDDTPVQQPPVLLPPPDQMEELPNGVIFIKGTETFQEQNMAGGAWGDFPDGMTPDAIDDAPAGTFPVVAMWDGNTRRYVRIGSGGVDVKLAQDGGTDGNSTTAPTYTYTITNMDGNPVNDAAGSPLVTISPDHNRPLGSTMVGKYGRWAWAADGAGKLILTDEAPNRTPRACP